MNFNTYMLTSASCSDVVLERVESGRFFFRNTSRDTKSRMHFYLILVHSSPSAIVLMFSLFPHEYEFKSPIFGSYKDVRHLGIIFFGSHGMTS